MNVSGIDFESIVDGIGVRAVIFISGCKHNCKGCHNPETHSFDYGREFTESLQDEVINYVKNTKFINGITLSGGDPMYSCKELYPFILKYKNTTNKSVWLYSGFTYEEILENKNMFKLLSLIDVLVDGKFFLEKQDITLPFRGSSNQRIIDVQLSIKNNKVLEFII